MNADVAGSGGVGDADVINRLAGIAPGSALDVLRERRPQARRHSQASDQALFTPHDAEDMAVAERLAVAAFVAGLHGDAAAIGFYDARLAAASPPALCTAVAAEARAAAARGPYGSYPAGPLSAEDAAGPGYRMAVGPRGAVGARLAAAFEHAHMLVFHPRDAAAASLQALLDAGWSATGIVTLSQLVAFLSYQIRVAAGLRIVAGHPAIPAAAPEARP